jgi:hypothetical protein
LVGKDSKERRARMRGAGLLLALLVAALVLFSGAALAQEESLPDLTVDKTGPSTATPDEFVTYSFDVTNVGTGDAVLPSGAVLVRDELSTTGRWTSSSTGGGIPVGVTGISGFSLQQVPSPPTRLIFDIWNAESTDAIISPGGGVMQNSVGVDTRASGGHIINCATADPDNVIVESDESNNTDCVRTEIRPQPL